LWFRVTLTLLYKKIRPPLTIAVTIWEQQKLIFNRKLKKGTLETVHFLANPVNMSKGKVVPVLH
jgi:hypothetical protein